MLHTICCTGQLPMIHSLAGICDAIETYLMVIQFTSCTVSGAFSVLLLLIFPVYGKL
jgi:hypothetical protein